MTGGQELQFTRCALCNEEKGRVLMRTGDPYLARDDVFDVIKCKNCGLVRTKAIPLQKDMAFWYQEHYGTAVKSQDLGEAGISGIRKSILYKFAQKMWHSAIWLRQQLNHTLFVASNIPAKGKIIDVGSGSGEILKLLKEEGASVLGVEPNPESAEIARRKGIEVICGRIESVKGYENAFDQMVFSFALEHMENPVKTLSISRAKLSRSGRVHIFCPNFNSATRWIFGRNWSGWHTPYHKYFFTKETLNKVLEQAGYEVLTLKSYTRPDELVESYRIWWKSFLGAKVVNFPGKANLFYMLFFAIIFRTFNFVGMGNALHTVAIPKPLNNSDSF